MITLMELLEKTDTTMVLGSLSKMPTAKAVRESGSPVIESIKTHDGSQMKVYENGFVTYSNSCRTTVFHLAAACQGYAYPTVDVWKRCEMFIPLSELLIAPWPVALIMIAEDRIAKNYSGRTIQQWSTEDIPDRVLSNAMKKSGNTSGESEDPLRIVISNETIELICHAMTRLSEKQREILIDFYVREKGIGEISERFSISIQGVCNSRTRSLKKLNAITQDLSKIHIKKLRRQSGKK